MESAAGNSQAYTIAQAAKAAGIGRSTLYAELSAGKLQARKLGRRTLILASDLSCWLSSLPTLRP
jgi:excisionase family DNA binding protein